MGFLFLIFVSISPNVVQAQKKETCPIFDGTVIDVSRDGNKVNFTLHAKKGVWNYAYAVLGKTDPDDDSDEDVTDYVSASQLRLNKFNPNKRGTFDAANGDFTFSVNRNRENEKEVIVFMWLKDETEVNGKNCTVEDLKSFKINSSYDMILSGNAAYKSVTVPIKSSKKSQTEQISNPECQAIGNATYYKAGNTGANDDYDLTGIPKELYTNMMRQKFAYCFTESCSSFELTNSSIRNVRHASLKAFNSYLKFKEAANSSASAETYQNALNEAVSQGYKKVSDTNVGTLSCSKSATAETTEKYYKEKTIVDNKVCSVKCMEQFQVTYDPPVAVKAGLCFQYKVTVRSKVVCKTQEKPGFEWPTAPVDVTSCKSEGNAGNDGNGDVCDFVAVCENSASITQAGPNEDFDRCVVACDNGKYSQSCINSCYNQVYGSSKKNTKNKTAKTTGTLEGFNDLAKVELLANNRDPYKNIAGCKNNGEIRSNVSTCASEFYKLKQQYPLGYYRKAGSNAASWIDYKWQPCFDDIKARHPKKCSFVDDNDVEINYTVTRDPGLEADSYAYRNGTSYIEAIKRAAPYYLRSKAETEKLLKSFWGQGYKYGRYYIIGDAGIKRQYSSRYKCDQTCGFLSNGSKKDCTVTTSKDIDRLDVDDSYVQKLNKIGEQFEACTTNATCKEDKATFYIDVTDKKTYSNKDKESWTANNKSSSKSSTPQTGGDTSMFIPLECTDAQKNATPLVCDVENVEAAPGINGICYGRDNPRYWQHYKTTITFPGTWINLKSAERVYKQPNSSSLDGYREKKNYYCTGYDSEDVNVAWWNWKVNGIGNVNSISLEKNNNITADISGFGKFDWSVGLKCFFGLSTEICDPSSGDPRCNFPEDEDGDPCSSENSTAICNYKFRVIDQQNMFPDEQGLKGNRERGFNWTTQAIDHTIPTDSSYFIDPEKYYQQLEASADSAFPKTDSQFSNADYRIKLSLDNIRNIKTYVKKNNFNAFTGSYHKVTPEVEGLYYYRSGLRNNTSLVSSWTGDVAGRNNN